jgi:hypothetical protein
MAATIVKSTNDSAMMRDFAQFHERVKKDLVHWSNARTETIQNIKEIVEKELKLL